MITVETIRERHSVREYDGGPLSRAEFDALGAVVEECARESGLDIQLVGDNPRGFQRDCAFRFDSRVPHACRICG